MSWRAATGRRRLVGATVDHQLQSGSADRAVATARQLADIGYQQVEVLTVEVAGPGGPEAAARQARYTALRHLAEQVGTPDRPCAVLLAHTADDQAETVLLGLARGSGPRSIAGMRPWRPPWGRPLLGVTRASTEATCRSAGLLPWQDPHNDDPAFTRVRLRHEVLPLLDEVLRGGVRAALARTAEPDGAGPACTGRDRRAWCYEQVVRADGSLDAATLATQPRAVIGRVLTELGGRWPVPGRCPTSTCSGWWPRSVHRQGPAQVRVPGGFDVLLGGDVVLRIRPSDRQP